MKKYITRNKYDGLDPKLAQMLKQGDLIEGYFWDKGKEKYKGELRDYIFDDPDSFENKEGDAYEYFEPIFEEETDWSEVPIDTKILVWNNGNEIPQKRYFAGLNNKGKIKAWEDGKTSWTQPCCLCWLHAEIYKEQK